MNTLVKYSMGSLLLGFSLFGACKSSEVAPIATDRVTLGQNKSARIGADITVRVDTLQDSRCPTGATCIWEGEAFVSAVVSNSTAQQRVRLYFSSTTRRTQRDSAGVTLAGQTYKVLLRDVVPYRDLAKPQQEQQAIIQVTKL